MQKGNTKFSNATEIRYCIFFILIIFLINSVTSNKSADVTFQFPEYDYKETSKNVRILPFFSFSFIKIIDHNIVIPSRKYHIGNLNRLVIKVNGVKI